MIYPYTRDFYILECGWENFVGGGGCHDIYILPQGNNHFEKKVFGYLIEEYP
jgi:hypothetical protein